MNGLAGGALAKIVEARDDDEAFAGVVQSETDIAEIGVRDVLQFRQRAGGPDAHHGAAGVELAEDGFDFGGGTRFAQSYVDGGEDSASEGEEMR